MIKIHTYLNGEFLNTYWCDGLVVATPTGSTGYNMSCNGPIVFPDSSSFVITPVAPHNLNVRPIVVPDSTIISFEVESRSDQIICVLDARREIVKQRNSTCCKTERFSVSLIRLNENNFLHTSLKTYVGHGYEKLKSLFKKHAARLAATVDTVQECDATTAERGNTARYIKTRFFFFKIQ